MMHFYRIQWSILKLGYDGLECTLDLISCSILIDYIYWCPKRKGLLVISTEYIHDHTHKPTPTSIIYTKPSKFVEMGQYSG